MSEDFSWNPFAFMDDEEEPVNVEEIQKDAEAGETEAAHKLAMYYLNGEEGLETDFETAFQWMKKAAECDDDSEDQFNVGLMYAKGCGCNRDYKEAARWMGKAAENGDEDAERIVDDFEAIDGILLNAEKGDSDAQAKAAKFFMSLGCSLDQMENKSEFAESFEWAKKSAAQGNTEGLYLLGLSYDNGRGVEENLSKAYEAYEKAAKSGHAPSQWNLGILILYNGEFGDKVKAFEWMYQSYNNGYEFAAERLEMTHELPETVVGMSNVLQPDWKVKLNSGKEASDICENLKDGQELAVGHKEDGGRDVLEVFAEGKSIGIVSNYGTEDIMAMYKLGMVEIKTYVYQCVPKSKKGKGARKADLSIKYKLRYKGEVIDNFVIGFESN